MSDSDSPLILRTLQNIEKAVKGGSSILAGSSSSSRGGIAGGRAADQDERDQQATWSSQKKIMVSTGKAVDRLGYASNRAGESLIGFSRQTNAAGTGLGNFTQVVAKSMTNIKGAAADLSKVNFSGTLGALQDAVKTATDSIKTAKIGSGDLSGIAKSLSDFDTNISDINPGLGAFNAQILRATRTLTASYGKMSLAAKDQGENARTFGTALGVSVAALTRNDGISDKFRILQDRLIAVNYQLRTSIGLVRQGNRGGGRWGGGGGGGRGGSGVSDEPDDNTPAIPKPKADEEKSWTSRLLGFFSPVKLAAGYAIRDIFTNVVKSYDDAFEVAFARGFDTKGFLELSKDAALAGMDMKEYTQLLTKSQNVTSRFKSFDAFDDQLDYARKQLKQFGIFGAAATDLSTTIYSSAQSMGVPVADLNKSVDGQIKIFDELRKTTAITAEQFQEINEAVAQSDAAQRELLGLAPAERNARRDELVKIASIGTQMGLTAGAAKQLQDALLEQRKSTVKERFEDRGRIAQAFAAVGMDPATIAEIQQLIGKRNKTTDETKRQQELLGEYSARAEDIKQTGGAGAENVVETVESTFSGPLAQLVKLGGEQQAATDSGNQINKDTQNKLGDVAQFLGTTHQILEGFSKSPLLMGGAAIAGISAYFVWSKAQAALAPSRFALAFRPMFAWLAGKGGVGGGGIGDLPDVGGGPGGKKKGFWNRFRGGGSAAMAEAEAAAAGGEFNPTMSLGADGSGGLISTGAKKAGRFGRFGSALSKGAGALKGLGRGLPLIGSLIGIGALGYELSTAEEAAKPENGGDGDVGAVKGGAIGEAAGGVVGGIAGMFLGPVGGVIGAMIGAAAGKALGAWIGKDSAVDKNAAELKKNTDALIEARRAGAGSGVVSENNLDSLTSSVLQMGQAYAPPSTADLQKIQDDLNKKNGTNIALGSAATSNSTSTVPMFDAAGNVIGTQEVPNSTVNAAPISQTIASPVSVTPSSVNSAVLNTGTPDTDATAGTGTPSTAPTITGGTTQEQQLATLKQLVALQAKALEYHEATADNTGAAAKNSRPRAPDMVDLVARAAAQR